MKTQYEYIHFSLHKRKKGAKTDVWDILNNNSNDVLGEIRWYGAWRQYCFYSMGSCIFNKGCLSDIQEFIAAAMQERKK